MANASAENYWGPVTATIDWCEKNYAVSTHLAEFFNTISNIPCILLAVIGFVSSFRQKFEKRFCLLHLSNLALAVGSIICHTTMQKRHQQSDETPIVWEMLLYIYVLYSPDWHYTNTMPTFLCVYGAAFAVLHNLFQFELGFKIHYALLALLCLPRMYKYYVHTTVPSAKRLAHLYILTMALGCICWLSDRLFCDTFSRWSVNPQGHALWHIFIGFNAYFANTFLQFCRAQQLQWSPEIRYFLGLPYVKISKRKKD